MPFQPGQLAGDYEVIDVLGKGGMGHVYRVRNVISDRIEAMKVLLDDLGTEAGLEERFIAEIRTLARLDHPNVAKLHTAFKSQKQLLMVMEFVEGYDLAQRAKEGSIPIYKVLGYVKDVLAALGYAHKHGVVHRDIKPSNIMVTPQGTVKLMDFGIAKSNAEPLLTRPGTTLGSLLYMSPEQVRGNPVDLRSDLYSVGVVLYELTAGRCPFEAESTYQVLDAQLNAAPLPPMQINPSLPPALNEIILTALEKDPAKRFQSAEVFRKVLDSVTPGEDLGKTRSISDTDLYFRPATEASAPRPMAAMPPQTPPPSSAVPPAFAGAPAVPPSMPPAAQARNPQSRRSLWMAAGAIACLCVLGAALVAVPHFRKSSADSKAGNVVAGTPAPIAPSPGSSPGALTPGGGTASTVSQTDNSDIRDALKDLPNRSPAPSPAVARKPAPAAASSKSGQQRRTQTAPPSEPPPSSAAKEVPPAPAGPSVEELNKANEELVNMHARIEAVGQSLTSLKQQQAAAGLGLRGDMVASESRMNSYFQMAERAVQNKDLDSAQKYLDRTEQEVTKLEHFLGR